MHLRVPGVTSRPNGEPLVRLSGVNKWFGELHVLQDIDLEIARGEVVVVIGPSGSGKSTLCRAINRLESQTFTLTDDDAREEVRRIADEKKGHAASLLRQIERLDPKFAERVRA